MHKSSNTHSQKFLIDEQFTAVFPSLIRLLSGDVLSAVVLQAIHFRAQLSDLPDGWVAFTMQDLSDQIGISKYQAQRAINKLRDPELNLLFEDNQKGYNNSRIWKVDHDRLLELESNADSLDSQAKRNRSTNKADSLNKPSDIANSTSIEQISKEYIRTTRTYGDENHQACNLLADLIEANGSRRPQVTDKWLSDMERIHRIDERSWEQITRAIEWCQADDFWRANIMSPAKLRKQYDQLRLAAQRGNKTSKFTKTMDWLKNLENETKELGQ